MNIQEFLVTRYGPLQHTKPFQLTNFNLFYGKNEDGKTLTIDALVKLLLGKHIKNFEQIDRVAENPEGYVIIEDDKCKKIKLTEKIDLTKVADLTSSECRNIFMIRNSDLSVARESEFYTNVTDRLVGLRTEEISSIKKALQNLGKLTKPESNASLSGREEYGKIKFRINNASGLIEEIDGLKEEIKDENFDKLEEETVGKIEQINDVEHEIDKLEEARKREKYEKGKKALDKLNNSLSKVNELEIYNDTDEQLWRESERDIKAQTKEKDKLLAELKENKTEFRKIDKRLKEKEQEFKIFEKRKKKIDEEIQPDLKNYEIKSGELANQDGKIKFFGPVGIVSSILFGISLLGIIFNPLMLFYILAVVFAFSAIISGAFWYQVVKNKSWLAGAFERNKLTLSKLDLGADSMEEILSNIQQFNEEFSKRNGELETIRTERKILEEKINTLNDKRIPEIEEKIKKAEDEIGGIKGKSKEEILKAYSKKLKLKQSHEKTIEQQKSILNNQFGEEKENHWDDEIAELEEYKNKAKGVKFNEKTLTGLKQNEKTLKDELGQINEKMRSIQRKMEEVERKTNEIQIEGEHLFCKTSVDLEAIGEKLQRFIDENEEYTDNALEVMRTFEQIEAEEKEKVTELFGKNSMVSKYFKAITNGLYKEVIFNQETGTIEVKRKDDVLSAEKLSGGAYDQLYLSIRLALGDKILKGKKGFFIMDDPFVKADPDRLQRQIETLKKISESGWQILYFSAKGEINDALGDYIDQGAVNYIEVSSIYS